MSDFPQPPNPYDSPVHGGYGQPYGQGARQRPADALPVFCIVMFIVDLVFSLIRVPLVLLGIVALQAPRLDPVMAQTGLLEVATGAAMVMFGIPADIAMLLKQKWGLILAWVKVAALLGSVGVAFWQISFILDQFPPGSPQRMGAFVGGGIAGVIRLSLIGLYVTAVVKFSAWSAQRAAASPRPTQMY